MTGRGQGSGSLLSFSPQNAGSLIVHGASMRRA